MTGNLTVTGQTAPGFFALTPVATNTPDDLDPQLPARRHPGQRGDRPARTRRQALGITYVAKAGATAQAIFDVTGYFPPDATGATYVAV